MSVRVALAPTLAVLLLPVQAAAQFQQQQQQRPPIQAVPAVSGAVTDACSAAGIVGATVGMTGPLGQPLTTQTLAAGLNIPAGSFSFLKVPSGANIITTTKAGYVAGSQKVNVRAIGSGGPEFFRLTMHPSVFRIEGSVIVQGSNPPRPEPGAAVTLDPGTPNARTMRTDGSQAGGVAGRFFFDNVPNSGSHTVAVTMAGFTTSNTAVATPSCARQIAPIALAPVPVPPANWSLPLTAGNTDFMMGWFIRPNCANPPDPFIALTDMPSRPTCPNPLPNGQHNYRHTYVSSQDFFQAGGTAAAHGDAARACAGFPRFCAAVNQASLPRVTVHVGRLGLANAVEPAGAWDRRTYTSAAQDAITLKYNGTWFAKGSVSGGELIANPANLCSAAITVDATITWTAFSADAQGQAFQADVNTAARPAFLLHSEAPVQQIIIQGDVGCRSLPGRFSMGTGYLKPN